MAPSLLPWRICRAPTLSFIPAPCVCAEVGYDAVAWLWSTAAARALRRTKSTPQFLAVRVPPEEHSFGARGKGDK